MGYGFHWHPGVNPVLVTPKGNVMSLSVERDIPYLVVGSENSMPKKPVSYREVPLAPAVETTSCSNQDLSTMTGTVENETSVVEKIEADTVFFAASADNTKRVGSAYKEGVSYGDVAAMIARTGRQAILTSTSTRTMTYTRTIWSP
jgi:hypothetical protein